MKEINSQCVAIETGKPPAFEPPVLLRHGHVMTMAPLLLRRAVPTVAAPGEDHVVEVEPGTRLICHIHWQPERRQRPTCIVLHGLEGSADSHYVYGVAKKAFALGMNVVRMNMRNCGGAGRGLTLTPTLYNGGLSKDLMAVARWLRSEFQLSSVYAVGYSLGGNLVLKAAGEQAATGEQLLDAVAAVSPALDLEACVQELERPHNKIYEMWFLQSLRQKILEKARLYPELYDVSHLPRCASIRLFDDIYTAPAGGYESAGNYYYRASAMRVISQIAVPALILTAHDDPLVPSVSFQDPAFNRPNIELVMTRFGGHGGFISAVSEPEPLDQYWAENRVASYFAEVM